MTDRQFEVGDRVMIVSGPLAGHYGKVTRTFTGFHVGLTVLGSVNREPGPETVFGNRLCGTWHLELAD